MGKLGRRDERRSGRFVGPLGKVDQSNPPRAQRKPSHLVCRQRALWRLGPNPCRVVQDNTLAEPSFPRRLLGVAWLKGGAQTQNEAKG
ncbi:MAG: hypothetical protein JSV06_05455 [Myxococcales bacterium]|nr:MAG: hypothetical protein JSV06_05455 [Myxococcales bacterium]